MKNVTVKKDELLAALQANRAGHRAIFEEAVEGYKAEAIRQLENHIARIKSGAVVKVMVQLLAPEDHTNEYDCAIKMLEMEVRAEVEVDENDFACFVMDQWSWRRQFLTTNSNYSASATRQLNAS